MKEYFCTYCGQSTYDVDVDYLVGFDHLSCVLNDVPKEEKAKKKKPLEITNWTKLTA